MVKDAASPSREPGIHLEVEPLFERHLRAHLSELLGDFDDLERQVRCCIALAEEREREHQFG